MNWGYRIFLLYASFVVFILFMVFYASSQKIDLVAKDYYKQEIAYQEEIDKMKNLKASKEKLELTADKGFLVMQFPKNVSRGKIYFFRPSDNKKDFTIPLGVDDNGKQYFPMKNLEKGFWRIKINWKIGNKAFFMEEKVHLEANGEIKFLDEDNKVL